MTSGACVIGKTMALRKIFMSHSLFTQGGDLEIGKKAISYGMEVGHIPAIIKTYAPSTLKKWFRQRTFWMCGTFRHTIMNMKFEIWRFPFYFVYAVVVVYLMFPFRLYEIFLHPTKLLIIIPIYWMIIFAMNWRLRSWKLLLAPLYDLTQILIIVPVGAIRYFIFARKYKNMGIINNKRNNYR
jgi:cellulose synthase/poly-beta-1,6-N-acetylglucosamine synthase-like glycosyltransferase